tara:strand:+ start:303 stop:857 length:555 start_codon:yes stop_codon:yes gene_type:complete
MKKKKLISADSHNGIPTVESLNHGEFIVEEASTRAGDLRFRQVDTTELDRLLLKKKISPHQHQIGEEVLGVLHRARMLGIKGSNWHSGGIGGDKDISERQANAYAEANRIIAYVKNRGGNPCKEALISLLLEDKPTTSGACVLQVIKALNIVGEFFSDRYGWDALPDLDIKKAPIPSEGIGAKH